MPPRTRATRSRKAAVEPEPERAPSAATDAAPAPDAAAAASDESQAAAPPEAETTNGRPSKRARRSKAEQDEAQQAARSNKASQPQPQAPPSPPPPPPPPPTAVEQEPLAPPPPPEEDDAVPPPPPPPPAEPAPPPPQDEAPPPPPPAPAGEEPEEADEEEIGGAEYWARLAAEEEAKKVEGRNDLYLDTINRTLLDFDFEKICSVSLSDVNVYACLVCGKYFQGRGVNSYAYYHSINDGHRVYMNLQSGEVYILPDNYLVRDPSLADIKYLLYPTYSEERLAHLDAPDVRPAFDLQAQPYLPGFVGLNNISSNDYMNVVIQALAHVKPLRDFMLRGGVPKAAGGGVTEPDAAATATAAAALRGHASLGELAGRSELVRRFATLVRKLWNPRAFKPQVSPHEFLQEVNKASQARFGITAQSDPIEFLGWLLNRLHMDLGGGRKRPSVISACFQGELRIESQKVFVRSGIDLDDSNVVDTMDADGRKEGGQQDERGNAKFNIDREIKVDRSPFFLLAIDLPPMPVFQDVVEKNIIPQVSIAEVLAKYDGVSFQEARGMIRRYKCTRLPPYVVLHFRRFTKNEFLEQRNQTIVNFPVKGLTFKDYVDDPSLSPLSTTYDLVANITHEAAPGTVRENSIWRCQVHSRTDGVPLGSDEERERRRRHGGEAAAEEEKWFQIQDLMLEEINKSMLFLGETYIQIWERRGAPADVEKTLRRMAAAAAGAGGAAGAGAGKAKAAANGKVVPASK